MQTEKISNKLRIEILKMIYEAQSGHPGGSLSVIDFLTVLYFGKDSKGNPFLNHNPKNPEDENRDYFILSKGHCSPALYSILGEAGYFSKEEWKNFRKISSLLQGHPVKKIPGVEMTTGSLGQGLSAACGIAAGKRDKRVYAVLGDGEIEEGQIWEAIMSAAHYKLDNLIAVVDKNDLQIDGPTCKIMNSTPIQKKFASFGWEVLNIDNGNDHKKIHDILEKAQERHGKPRVIISQTIKGKGVSFMEGKCEWHGSAPNEEQFAIAMEELKRKV